MPLEPISVVSAISFSLQCGEILIKGFQTLKEKKRLLEEYQVKISEYKTQLGTCKERIDLWCKIWGFPDAGLAEDPKYPEETLKIFWTPSGYDLIEKQLRNVHYRSERVKGHLEGKEISTDWHKSRPFWSFKRRKGPDPPRKDDWRSWRNLVKTTGSNPDDEIDEQDASLLRKILFALFQNNELSEKIDALEKAIKVLDRHTRVHFNHFRSNDGIEPVRFHEVKEAYDSLQTVAKFTKFANSLYDVRIKEGGNWSLELRNPGNEESNAFQWTSQQVIYLDFTLHFHQPNPTVVQFKEQGCRRFRICYNPEADPEELSREVRDSVGRWLKLQDSDADKDKIETLKVCERQSRPMRSLFADETFQTDAMAHDWLHDQAALLLAFANWMVLLLNTPWTDQACCCQIRFERMHDGEGRYALSTRDESGEICHNVLSTIQKVRVLGLVLAEIILKRPLQFSVEDTIALGSKSTMCTKASNASRSSRSLGNALQERVQSGNGYVWKEISRHKILKEIKHNTNERVRGAVEFCFERDIPSDANNLRADITQSLREKVLAPLLEFFQTVDAAGRRYDGTILSRLTVASSLWPPGSLYDPKEDCRLRWTQGPVTKGSDGASGANFPSSNSAPKRTQIISVEWNLHQILRPGSHCFILFLVSVLAVANITVLWKMAN